jgi:signal peptidase I
MKDFLDRIKAVNTKGWVKCGIWSSLYIAFVIWVAIGDWISLLWLLFLPIIMDMFTTKYIPWNWWKKYKPLTDEEKAKGIERPHANKHLYILFSWIDAILFALIAVYFINTYFFQNYQIPTSSLEKTLRVGDFLCVNKMCYGARVPNTPLSMPLVQHTFPWGGKSYFENPQWEYKRLKGWDKVEKGDIVVFNFPAGDTVCSKLENPDIYTLRHILQTKGEFFLQRYGISSKDLQSVKTRPVDRRENYVKRCVATPGDKLQIIDNVIYINGEAEPTHPHLQYNYYVKTNGNTFSNKYLTELGISLEDRNYLGDGIYHFPLTREMKNKLANHPNVISIEIEPEEMGGDVYPLGHNIWTRDNYGPIYIPRKGDKIMITAENYWLYKRIADAYEFKPMKIGQTYEFEMDYYWMMGDNRHKSADSRYWGFVPEDHIIGRPMFIWLSIDNDKAWGDGRIRWDRIGLSDFE